MLKKNVEKIVLSSAIGAGTGLVLTSILIFIIAAILTIGDIPAVLISPVTVFFLALGGFGGGFISAKLSGEKGMLCGAFSGIIFFIIVWLFGTFFEKSGFGISAVIKASMIIISASLGGIIGVNNIKRK